MESDVKKVTNCVPVKPKAGDLYVVDCDALPNKNDVLYDRYFWRHNESKKYPKGAKDPYIHKSIYNIRDKNEKKECSTKFQRHVLVYQLLDNNRYKILQNLGDESLVTPTSHGNSKSGNEFVPTKPSVIDQITLNVNVEDLTKAANVVHTELKNKAKHGTDMG